MKKLICLSILLVTLVNFAQTRFVSREIPAGQTIELKDKKMFINNEQIPAYEIKKYLKDNNFKAYSLYTKAKNKSVLGGLLLGLGSVFIISDGVRAAVTDGGKFPSVISYVGGALVGTSLFVLKGKNKKMENAIDFYNSSLKTTADVSNQYEANVTIVGNANGLGLRLNF